MKVSRILLVSTAGALIQAGFNFVVYSQPKKEIYALIYIKIKAGTYVPINVKPHYPPRHRWGFVQFVVQRTHTRGKFFLQYPS